MVYQAGVLTGLLGGSNQYVPHIFEVLIWAASLRELAPETYVAGTGPGTTCQQAIDFCVNTLFG